MLTDQHLVAVIQSGLADTLIVHVGAIERSQVFDDVLVPFARDLGMMAGDGKVVDLQLIVR